MVTPDLITFIFTAGVWARRAIFAAMILAFLYIVITLGDNDDN